MERVLAEILPHIEFFQLPRFPEHFQGEAELYNIGRSYDIELPKGFPRLTEELYCFQNALFNLLVGVAYYYTHHYSHLDPPGFGERVALFRESEIEGFVQLTPTDEEEDWESTYPGLLRLEAFQSPDCATLYANLLATSATALVFLNACDARTSQLTTTAGLERVGFDVHNKHREVMEEQIEEDRVQEQIEIVNERIVTALQATEDFDMALEQGQPPLQRQMDAIYRTHGYPEKAHKNSLMAANYKLYELRDRLATNVINAEKLSGESEAEQHNVTRTFNQSVPGLYEELYPLLLDIAISVIIGGGHHSGLYLGVGNGD